MLATVPPKQAGFDYEALDAETSSFLQIHAGKIHQYARQTALGIHLIGHHLSEARKRLKDDGVFLRWIEDEFSWSQRAAYRFLQVYENIQLANLANCEIDVSALYLIAEPKTPEVVRGEIIRRAEHGEPVSHGAVREVIRQYEHTGDLPGAAQTLREIVSAAKHRDTRAQTTLPSPSEARRLAIETGAHTLDYNGVYQPPMTKAEQTAWSDDWDEFACIANFLRACPAGEPAELAAMVRCRCWTNEVEEEKLDAVIDWLTQFKEALWSKSEIGNNLQVRRCGNGSSSSLPGN